MKLPQKQLPLRLCIFLSLLLILIAPIAAQDAPDASVRPIDSNLRLRAEPLDETGIIGYLAPESPLAIVSRTGDSRWLEVRTGDERIGWVDADFIKLNIEMESIPVNPEYAVPFDAAALVTGVGGHLGYIFERGQSLGNRANIFSKVGDSITVATHTLNPVGEGLYTLGAYRYLQSVIDFYSAAPARSRNSFSNPSLAAQIGWTTTMLLDPANAPEVCQGGENALECEYRLVRPSVALIMFGTNDVEVLSPEGYRAGLSRIVEISLDRGVIPVLTTIPPRPDFEAAVTSFNQVILETARAYGVPLLDYYASMKDLPGFGLDIDDAHPGIPPRGYDGSADFSTPNLQYGYVMRNLTLLHALDAVWREVIREDE
jgi:hypothetical protein